VIQIQYGRDSEEKKSLHCLYLEMKPGRPACNLVTILIELLRLIMYVYIILERRRLHLYLPWYLILGIFLFTTASRTALGPAQPLIQWIPGSLSLGVKRPRREADHSPPPSTEVKERMELYLHSPKRLHGVVLS
jgi:hypothetical protein